MKSLLQKMLSIIISLLIYLGFPSNIITENNTEIFAQSVDNPYDDYQKEQESIQKMLTKWNAIPHEDLAGYYTNYGKEIVITGFRATSYDNTMQYYFNCKKDVVRIPDEIDGIPVTTIAESAFEYGYYGTWQNVDVNMLIVGNNVENIHRYGLYDIPNIVVGKNVTKFDNIITHGADGKTLYCYNDSEVYKHHVRYIDSWYSGMTINVIDESHLTSAVAEIDENGNVRGLPSGLTKETVNDYLSVDGGAIMEISDEVIGTGTTIKLIHSEYGTIDNTYTVIMDGDINGDGSVNTSDDTAAMRKIITGSDSEFSEANKKAADLNGDGLINSTDLILMKSMQN